MLGRTLCAPMPFSVRGPCRGCGHRPPSYNKGHKYTEPRHHLLSLICFFYFSVEAGKPNHRISSEKRVLQSQPLFWQPFILEKCFCASATALSVAGTGTAHAPSTNANWNNCDKILGRQQGCGCSSKPCVSKVCSCDALGRQRGCVRHIQPWNGVLCAG